MLVQLRPSLFCSTISPHVASPGPTPLPSIHLQLIVVFLFCYVFNQVCDVHSSTTEVLISRYVATMFSFVVRDKDVYL